jgi:hypothetical protein
MPLFIVEFRPIRYLLLVLIIGVLRGAVHGDWQALVILSGCVALLWWHSLLDAVRQVWKAVDEACMFMAWMWGRLFR